MQLNGIQRQQVHDALLSAFPNENDIKRLVSFGLNENLSAITGNGVLSDVVFNVINWSEAHDRINDLLDAAVRTNPDNSKLRNLTDQLSTGANDFKIDANIVIKRQSIDVVALRQQMIGSFDLEEFRDLCFDLGVDFDNLRGEGKAAKVRELITYLQRRDDLDRLIAAISRQ
jgi:hypothetical protein